MTENFYTTRKFNVDHSAFGGIIYQSDFETDYRGKDNNNGSSIAQRIVSDLKFDEQCRKNIENRKRDKKYQASRRNQDTVICQKSNDVD